jgi:hypothetical protein
MQIEDELPVVYPWYCLAIRGHNPFSGLIKDRQKNLGQKNGSSEICTPLSQSTIFLPLDFSAFPLVVPPEAERLCWEL